MKIIIKLCSSFILVLGIIGCQNTAKQLSVATKESYLIKGDSIANQAQQTLLKNVSMAINEKGVNGAVEFCNINANSLTDSMSSLFLADIQRISDKNRNPNNALSSEMDKGAWKQIMQLMEDKEVTQKHILVQKGKEVYYYKAIPLGMPTCLSCHGNTITNIAPETLNLIQTKYPTDKAIGYQLGNLRGLWKIKMNKQ